jgi:hypothetical protein
MAASRDGAGGGEEDEDDDEGGGGEEEEARKPTRAGAAGAADGEARARGTSCSARRSREACTKSPGARVKACILTKISEVRFLAA